MGYLSKLYCIDIKLFNVDNINLVKKYIFLIYDKFIFGKL